jgi:hypothetical protein
MVAPVPHARSALNLLADKTGLTHRAKGQLLCQRRKDDLTGLVSRFEGL